MTEILQNVQVFAPRRRPRRRQSYDNTSLFSSKTAELNITIFNYIIPLTRTLSPHLSHKTLPTTWTWCNISTVWAGRCCGDQMAHFEDRLWCKNTGRWQSLLSWCQFLHCWCLQQFKTTSTEEFTCSVKIRHDMNNRKGINYNRKSVKVRQPL